MEPAPRDPAKVRLLPHLQAGSEKYDAILAGLAAYRNDFSVIVDAEPLEEFPPSSGIQEFVEIAKLIITVKKAVKILVTLGQGPADDFSIVVEIAGDAERSAQSSQHTAGSILLPEGFNATGFRVERYACALRNVIQRKHIVLIVIERPEVDNFKPLGAASSFFTVLSCLDRLR
jgi:hypothetical protein